MRRWLPSAAFAVLVLMVMPFATAAGGTPATPGSSSAVSLSGVALLSLQRAQLTAPGGAANDNFGSAVAISGDIAIVGAPADDVATTIAPFTVVNQGSAYVFVRSGQSWVFQQQLTAADGAAGDAFGCSVALSGETAVIGASGHTVVPNANQGSAYVFTRSGTTWTLQQQLIASDAAASDNFGCSVALSGETALVGANQDDVAANTDQGTAYVFVRSGTSWTQQRQLIASDGAANDRFGWGVALSGETALVGANHHDVGANADQGAAYVFTRSGTTWTQQQLLASDGAAGDRFGYAVALAGETAIVGAPFDDVGTRADQGSATVFVRSGTTWTQQQQLAASDGATGDDFGYAVALDGELALIGAYWDDIGSKANQGSADIFLRSGTTWSQQQQLTATDGATNDRLGCAVALSGDTVLVGAYWDDVGANLQQGSAYVFPTDGVAPVTTASVAPPANEFGWHAAPVTLSLQASDALSGVAATDYRLAGAAGWTPYGGPFSVSSPGISTWEYRSIDAAGNLEEAKTLTVSIDPSPPTTTARATPAANSSGWRRSAVTVSFSASDGLSGPASTQYRLAGAAAWTTYNWPFKITRQGLSTCEFRSLDYAGNLEVAQSLAVRIDSKKPTTRAFAATVRKGKRVALRYRVLDASSGSGKAKVTLRICAGKRVVRTLKAGPYKSNVTRSYSWRCGLPRGLYTIKVYATDIAGNTQAKVGTARLTVR
jgi:FG-GAP repeat